VGAITRDRLEAVRESDAILREEFAKNGLEGKVWQYFTIVPDFKSTGIRDGLRTYDWPVVLRAVNTRDAVTATVEDLPFALLQHITARITSEVKGVNRVLYDLTPKPTGTIEWE
jgi:GMP synthase (glutamine-hydrolysing)